MGHTFRNKVLWENASRNRRSEWDTVSAGGPLRKARPRIGVQNGAQFPHEGSGEIASRSEPGAADTVSLLKKEGALPAIDAGSAPFAQDSVEG